MPPVVAVVGAIKAILVSAEVGLGMAAGATAESLATSIMVAGAMVGANKGISAISGAAKGKIPDAGRAVNSR